MNQIQILRGMTMEQRWSVAQNLYYTAREWKASTLRSLHPNWDERKINEAVRKSFLHVGQ